MDAWAPPQTFAKRESLLKQSPVPVSRRVFCQLMFHPTRRNVTASDDRPRTIIVPYTPYTRYKHIYCIKTIEHVARYSITGARLVHDTSEISPYSSLSLAVSIRLLASCCFNFLPLSYSWCFRVFVSQLVGGCRAADQIIYTDVQHSALNNQLKSLFNGLSSPLASFSAIRSDS